MDVTKGGTGDAPRQVADGVWAVVITLDTRLRAAESCDLVYETTFDFRHDPDRRCLVARHRRTRPRSRRW